MKPPILALLCALAFAGVASADSLSVAPTTAADSIAGAITGAARIDSIARARADSAAAAKLNTHPPVRAMRATSPIRIDGKLDEPIWHSALPATGFKQRDPDEGAAPRQKTEVRLAYDDEAIYVGARMFDTAPDSIYARLSRRDVSVPADRFSIYLDPYHDRRSGYYFLVNAAGTLFDGTVYNDGWEDSSWDGVWHCQVGRDALGWTAEMKIPYSQLRFQKSDSYVWGVNFRRVIPRYSEEDFLVYQPKKESGFVSRFPELVGIESVAPGSTVELIPYVTSRARYLPPSLQDPFNDESNYDFNGGADLRMGVGSKLTLNATVNPDFGQVEVDPAVVNLSDYETFFPEKRPFFVEGSNNFHFGQEGASNYWGFNWPQPTFFYSRRIGRAPAGGVPDSVTTDGVTDEVQHSQSPSATTILGAAKITGKLASNWNFGTLHAITAREKADVLTGTEPNYFESEYEVEPNAYYGVVRGQKEFKNRQQGLGLMTTVVARAFEGDWMRDALNGQSVFSGVDGWAFLDKNQTWVVSGWSGMSYVAGNTTRMTDLQQNSTHYQQRPDADHVEVDPNAKSMMGFGSRYWLNKQKGSSFANAAIGFMDPNFEVNDLGFQSRSDVINGHFGFGYKWTERTKHRKYQDVLIAAFDSHDFQGNNTWGGIFTQGFTEFANNYSWDYRAAYNWQTVNNRRTRGGPLTLNLPGYEFGTYFDTDGKAKRFFYVDAYTYFTEAGSYNWNVFPGFQWKPVSNVVLDIGPGYERVHEDAQYVDTITDPTATETYGTRYVFGVLDQETVSAQIRLSWAFTPNLGLQTYLQPLISSGQYTDFKSLAYPKSYAFDPYAYDPALDPSFNYRSLRGNAILRWEYMPGSTLYLVWTQTREEEEQTGNMAFGKSSSRLLDADADNIFLAKVTYYLNR